MPFSRDPVSELMDNGAAALLTRAYARPGQWVGTSLAPPKPEHMRWAAAQGVDLNSVDDRGVNRWMRGFIRAIYYQHKWYARVGSEGLMELRRDTRRMSSDLVKDTRAIVFQAGVASPMGRAIRIRVVVGGKKAYDAVPKERRYTEPGNNRIRNVPQERDWDWAGVA
jgi:hypothetical protein